MIFLTCLFCLVCVFILTKFRRASNLPPGPVGLPFFGYLFFIERPSFKSLHRLGKIYGKIFSLTICGRTVIVINELSLIKHILVNRKEFSGRTTLFVSGLLAKNHGISNYDGEFVDIKRKILSKYLRTNDYMESIIDEECSLLINFIKTITDEPCNSRLFFNKCVSNIIWKIVFGTRFDYSSTNAILNVENVAINNTENDIITFRQLMPRTCSILVQKFPLMKKLLNLSAVFNRYENITEFIKLSINNRKLFNESIFEAENNSKIHLSDKETTRLVFELFAAGTDTIILTLQWGMLLLCIHPKEQEKMRKEIKEFIITPVGKDIFISWNDRQKLRYCQQVIAEIHRYASVTPLALPHRALTSSKVEGFDIPYNSIVLIDIYSVHYDQNIWIEPQKFNPERFNGRSPTEKLIPFSLGTRTCPGSSLAQTEIFTILTNIVINYKILPVKKNLSLDDLGDGTSGLTRGPSYHELIFKKLNDKNSK